MTLREIINKRQHKSKENIIRDEPVPIASVKESKTNNFVLKLTSGQARDIIEDLSDAYTESNTLESPLFIDFDDDLSVTRAKTVCKDGSYTIILGMKELSSANEDTPVKDMDFLKAAVSLYHEIAHYEDGAMTGKTKRDLITEFWTHGNKDNYFHNWSIIPYEIRAEHKGVMSAWEHVRQIWPTKADDLMIKRLTERADTSNYMIKVSKGSPNNKFQSEDQVNELFEEALKQAPDKKHSLSDGFLFSTDEIAQMMTIEPGVLDPKYAPFYLNLSYKQSGESFDRKMASLVAYIHPTREDLYPEFNSDDLDPEMLFGMPVPETSEEIGNRIIPQTESDLFCSIEQAPVDKWDHEQIGQELEGILDQMNEAENITNFEI